MIIVATIIIFKQFLKKIILSIVEPQVFVLLLLSSPNFAQDANNGETLIYFSTNWFADFFCDWEKDPLFFALSSPFLANSLFFLRKERVRGSLEICRVPQNGRHWTSQHYLAGWSRNTKKKEADFVFSTRNYFRKLFTMQSWNQVKKVWKRPLRSAWNRWLWWCRLGPWILMRELYISQ